MTEQFILIPGRTARQGVGISQGKFDQDYLEETQAVQMTEQDMKRLGLCEGARVRLSNECGQVELSVVAAKDDELPAGVLFMAFGPRSSLLMDGDTHGSGMPTSKGIDVQLQVM